MDEDLCECGKESTKGCHGVKDKEVYSEHYCDECFNSRNSTNKILTKRKVNEIPNSL